MKSISSIYAVFYKELKSEFRTRSASAAVALFVLTAVTVAAFGTSHEQISSGMAAGILWIIMFFSAMTGLAKIFIYEEERGTSLLLQTVSSAAAVYFGKLIFNTLMSIAVNTLAVLLYLLLLNQTIITHPGIFALTIFLSSIGLSSAATIISALIARANSKNALFPVLAFPIVLPLIVLGIDLTRYSFEGGDYAPVISGLRLIVAYSGVLVTASWLLFDFIWRD